MLIIWGRAVCCLKENVGSGIFYIDPVHVSFFAIMYF